MVKYNIICVHITHACEIVAVYTCFAILEELAILTKQFFR